MRACNRNARQHFRRATFYRNLKEKCRGPEPGTTLCASLRSKCTSPFHKSHFIQEKCGAQSEHPDQAPAFTATVKTPQCGHTVWGKTYSVFAFCVTIGAVSKRRQPNSSNQTCQAKGKVEKNRKTLFQHGQLFLASLNGKNPTLSGWYV